MRDTLVVFGGGGFLGTHVRREAARHALQLVAPGRDAPLGELRALSPRAIVCCSALSSLADCKADPARAHEVNAELPRRLARLGARVRGAWCTSRPIWSSTAACSPGARYSEGDAPAPLSVYGRTKHLGEQHVLREDPSALVVRLALTGDSFGRGKGAEDSLYAAIARGEEPVCFEDEWRTPIDVAEAARALVLLALLREPHGVLHLGGEERLSRWEIGGRACTARGSRPRTCAAARARRRASRASGRRTSAWTRRARASSACEVGSRAMKLALAASVLFLAGCASTHRDQRTYEIRAEVYEMPVELARELSGIPEFGACARPASTLERVRAAQGSHPEIERGDRPAIRVRTGVSAGLSTQTESTFVQDYTIDAHGESQPVKKTIREGTELDFRPQAREAGLELECHVKQSRLKQPVRVVPLRLSNGETKPVQLTELESQEITKTLALAEGECAAVLLPGAKPELATLVCVTVTPATEHP